MSGGEGVIMLASSHALISRITLESGRGGRGGGGEEGQPKSRSMAIGIAGTGGGVLAPASAWVEGAVRGWSMDTCS